MEHTTVGRKIRDARVALGISAMDLAKRAGVTENAIQKIESGASKQPSFDVGLKIAIALSISAESLGGYSSSSTHSTSLASVIRALRAHRDELQKLGITETFVFGSVARGEDGPNSDIDLIIDVPSNGFSLLDLSRVGIFLEDVLGRKVDLITKRAVQRDPRFSEIFKEAVNAF